MSSTSSISVDLGNKVPINPFILGGTVVPAGLAIDGAITGGIAASATTAGLVFLPIAASIALISTIAYSIYSFKWKKEKVATDKEMKVKENIRNKKFRDQVAKSCLEYVNVRVN